jgi:hypothetical protein
VRANMPKYWRNILCFVIFNFTFVVRVVSLHYQPWYINCVH